MLVLATTERRSPHERSEMRVRCGELAPDVASLIRATLLNEPETGKLTKDWRAELKSMQRDVQSLLDHTTYLTNNITFLLDAMVGFVTIEQNNVIKIFSVVSVVLMPPTLVASIYGMNFRRMPELDWAWGYPFAIGLMLVAAVLPYLFFKWRRWL